jgi:hypothetical protein
MKKVWFFGDSYCAYEENWVKQVSINLNAEIANLGIPGSSVFFLLDDLLEKKDKIQKQDTVILCVTNTQRHFFNNIHLQPYMVDTLTKEDAIHSINKDIMYYERFFRFKKVKTTAEDIYEAYKVYMKNLHTHTGNWHQGCSTTCHILDSILPSLKTKNILTLFSIYHDEFLNYSFFNPNHIKSKKSLWEFTQTYIEDTLKIKDVGSQVKAVNAVPNHWIDTPEFHHRFWSTFNPAFKTIGADTPIKDLLI